MYSEAESADLKRIGENIRSLRSAKNFSQESFADAVGLHRTYMGGVERGERNLSTLNLLKIIRKLDVLPEEIFNEVL
ncbi:MAG: helix-turn-helix transcriptional regulator [Lachnospiraceae bacterium]|nr:helix-turn-helix transcriptional regulator [Lachnospiraceae bacterium]